MPNSTVERPTSPPPSPLETAFTLLLLIYNSGAILGFATTEGIDTTGLRGTESVTVRVISMVVYAILGIISLRHVRPLLRVASRNKLFIALLGLMLVSAAWSQAPALTLRRALMLGAIAFIGMHLGVRFTVREQLSLVARAIAFSIVASLIIGILLPSYGISHGGLYEGAWRGAFVQKNILGRMMALGVVVFLLRARAGWPRSWLWFSLSVALLFLSRAKGAMIVVLLMMLVIPSLKALSWPGKKLAAVAAGWLVVTGVIAWWVLHHLPELLFTAVGDSTLTGRGPLWLLVLMNIRQRPWLGYGYAGFWLGPEGPSGKVWRLLGWAVPHAHNGYLDLVLDLGLIGLLLFLAVYFVVFRRAVRFSCSSPGIESRWPLAYLAFVFLYNLTESSLIGFYWILFTGVATSMAAWKLSQESCEPIPTTSKKLLPAEPRTLPASPGQAAGELA